MTPLSSTRKSINKTSFNTLTVLTLLLNLQWRTIRENSSIHFLDTIVKPEADGGLSITMYRKPTHTDQYLQWDSHHNLSAKFSVINTLSHRAKTVCSNPVLLKQEKNTLGKLSPNTNILNGPWTSGEKTQQVFQRGHCVLEHN